MYLVFVVLCITLGPFYFCNHLRGLVAALIVFLMSCDCKCSVALPHSTVGWSTVCICGFS